MKLKLGENTELQKYTVLSLTSDEKGQNIIGDRFAGDISEEQEIEDNDVYIHYPYKPENNLIVFGDADRGRLGLDQSGQTTEPKPHTNQQQVNNVKIFQIEKCMATLDSEGLVWISGDWDGIDLGNSKYLHNPNNKMDKIKEKIVDLSASESNIGLLTETGKVWFCGYGRDNHLGEN